jgi:type II secretion system protein N
MKTLLIVLAALMLLCFGTWMIGISETTIRELMALPLKEQGISIETEGLTKGIFCSLAIQKATLVQHDSAGSAIPLLTVTDVSAHLDLGSLLVLRPRIGFKGSVGDGTLTGSIALSASDETTVKAASVALSHVPFVALRGIRGDGTLSWDVLMQADAGELKLRIDNARLRESSVEGVALPLDMFHEIRGLFIIGRDATEIRSLALEGKGIYARLRGTVQKGALASVLEVSVDTSVRENLVVAAMIERYKVSPGYYEIPVSRKLSSFVSH